MADPLQLRFSNSSDDSPFQEDQSDSEHDSIPLEDHNEAIETLDPRNSQLSLVSGAGLSLDDRRHHHHRGLAHRDFFKYLVEEGNEVKKLRKVLRAALERLDGETRRAQEAERRALELAQRFKIVNEARVTTQQELDRVHAELRMYQVQLDNAQREIHRGSDLLKDIEAQRDTAEASAARARSIARRLKEQQLMMQAREEGRKEGYQEGLRRGYQQAGGSGIEDFGVPPAGVAPLGGLVGETSGASRLGDFGRTDPLDDMSMFNLSTPLPSTMPLASSFGAALGAGAPAGVEQYDGLGAGAQGSRFRENIGSPSTLQSAPLDSGSQAGNGWRGDQEDEIRYLRPTLVHNAPASPQHSDYSVPPDGYIPSVGAGGGISLPPPHELHPQPSMSTIPPSSASFTNEPRSATVPAVTSRDYAYAAGRRGSPRSLAESLPSTTISQFDLVSSPKTATRGLRERSSGLSAIPEVASSLEFSPGTAERARSAIFPDPLTFPMPEDVDTQGSGMTSMPRTRSRDLNQRIADELRYDDPDQLEQWRRSTASQSIPSSSRERLHSPHRPAHITTPSPLGRPSSPATPSPGRPPSSHRRSRSMQSPPSEDRSYLGAGSSAGTHRRTTSSTPISIHIEPPSGPGSHLSPASLHDGMLSPDTSRHPLPPSRPDPYYPERPQSRGYSPEPGYGTHPAPQSPSYFPPFPTRHTPEPAQRYPNYPVTAPSSSTGHGRSSSRGAPVEIVGAGGDFPGRPRTPSSRPSSAVPGDRPPSARPITPAQSYIDPQRVPSVLRSPSRASSRQSVQPDLARPSSRTSADRHRSLSLHAGSTPAMVPRPLSGGSDIRRVPSASSMNSETSRKSGFQRYNPTDYVDPAFLASAEDLTSVQSPNTMANTRANAAWTGPGPSKLRSSSPSMSYASLRN
ncbi:hypothetical protein K466DRAFT_516387 [Polyporus arcularius HHB13444]|uniref:Uncharacterized protein n=1 Tax=Polyporus arcularius HHB13444 TaxID=1314778 RepID=A0A5C3PR81_9APHY|nr:hypothetical protein K466DRAFT_516387 [Polyporus arcularius HHB13444]